MMLNRFGKAEAEGGGLRSAFVRAMEAGIPVLTAVRPPYIEAWSKFHGRLAVDLPADLDCRAGLVPGIGAVVAGGATQPIVANRLNAGSHPWMQTNLPRSAS